MSTENPSYLKFDIGKAKQDLPFMGKHLAEMVREPNDDIPQIFSLLFGFFDENPTFLQSEGIFRKGGDEETMQLMSRELQGGNYDIMTTINDPFSVAVFIK